MLLIAGQFDPDEVLRLVAGPWAASRASRQPRGPPPVVAVGAPRSFTDSGSRTDIDQARAAAVRCAFLHRQDGSRLNAAMLAARQTRAPHRNCVIPRPGRGLARVLP